MLKRILGVTVLTHILTGGMSATAQESQSLYVAYPPPNHSTTAAQIFFIGTAPPQGEVTVNDQTIQRSPAGHFAPSFPLQVGENVFTLRHNNQELQLRITRTDPTPTIPSGVAFAENSLTPAQNIARLPGESVCFSAVAPPNGQVSVRIGNQTVALAPQTGSANLPPNNAVLMSQNSPVSQSVSPYQGCTTFTESGNLGNPTFQLNLGGQTTTQTSPAEVTILPRNALNVVEVTANAGVSRTGPGTDYSRLTPILQGTRATVTGREGDWLRLDYGAWIRENETRVVPGAVLPPSTIRSVRTREVSGATEIVFPLQTRVPVTIQQSDRVLNVTLHNLVAQTDTIFTPESPVLRRLDWQQVTPQQVQYTLNLHSDQQWGYDYRYEDTTLIVSVQHPPTVSSQRPLAGVNILIDPGHGGEELGARGPTGYPEKDANLVISRLIQAELERRGAIVHMTRETDVEVSLRERMEMIDRIKPAIALSMHYNALPDSGDAINTAGIGAFWYHPQAHSLAQFLHNYLVEALNRPAYGVFWNNLALTRPHTAPSVLMELGFMINPVEFEWIVNPQEQQRLANAIADGITEWLRQSQ